jgi:subtilisin family serine protease
MIKLIVIIIIVIMAVGVKAQITKPPVTGWHLLDYKKDGYRGISLEDAYKKLKGKKSNKVIVAVIDSGIDTLHKDIPFWTNPNEIPNNNIDDDKNGLVDDIHGWNYLGAPNGENLAISISDINRTYHRFKNEFENKTISQVSADMQHTYKEWRRADEKLTIQKAKADSELDKIKQNYLVYKETNAAVVKMVGKETFYHTDINALATQSSALEIWKRTLNGKTFSNTDLLKDFEQYVEMLESYKNGKTIAPVLHRDNLLQDNGYDISKTNYGNNNLLQHSGWHGTSVSSVIGAIRNNNIGMDGIADNVEIMMIRGILGKDEFDKDVALSIRYAVDNGAKVINMSFGKYISPDKHWTDQAVQYALSKDVVIVHAAGNDATDIDLDFNYPNAYYINGNKAPHFINVAASSDESIGSLIASFTNYGKKMVDVFAPGVKILCNISGTETRESDGTSMASPVVAGIAALLRSYYPHLKATQIVDIIKQSVTPVKGFVTKPGTDDEQMLFKDMCTTGGIVNAANAVMLAEKIIKGTTASTDKRNTNKK